MKTKFLAVAVTAIFITASLQCMSQPPGPRGNRDRPPRGFGPGQQQLQQVAAYEGQVTDWASNNDYVYDGFYLQTTGGKMLVKFPPHLGSQLTTAIKTGSRVTVNGITDYTPWGSTEIRMVSINANGQMIYDTPPATPPAPPVENFTNGNGTIKGLQKNMEGIVDGYILGNKTILRVPPHIAMQLSQIALTGSAISFTGMQKTPQIGEASAGNYTIVHAETITVNGTQYLTR